MKYDSEEDEDFYDYYYEQCRNPALPTRLVTWFLFVSWLLTYVVPPLLPSDRVLTWGNEAQNVHSHPPAFTSAELEEYAGSLGRHTKNLFAVSKKIGLVLVCARAEADTNFKGLGTKMGIKGGFSMAKEEVLERVLNVKKGSVGPMSIVNDSEKEVRFILDAGIMDLERVFSHPGRNDFSVGMKPEDLVKYVESTGRSVELIDFDMKKKE